MRPAHSRCQLAALSLLLPAAALALIASVSSPAVRAATEGQHQAHNAPRCAATGACLAPVRESAPARALGPLEPSSGLIRSGAISLTLRLTTTLPADCRRSGGSDIPYSLMLNGFQSGQSSGAHATAVSGLEDLDDRWLRVRCQDLRGGRDPDSTEALSWQNTQHST